MKIVQSIAIMGTLFFSLSGSLQAALPPLYQTAAEIVALLQDHELGKVLSDGEPIVEIHKIDTGYLVVTTKHQVQATIVYEPAVRPGPAQFNVKFQLTSQKRDE